MPRKGSVFFLFLPLVVISCQKSKGPQSLISKLVTEDQTIEASRSIANAPRCFKDRYTVEEIKKEIQNFEKKYKNGTPVTGKWKHLDLSSLPISQANMLKKIDKELGDVGNPDAIDFSGCQDVVCLHNRVYAKPDDHINGYVHYLWYLKFGSLIAADNVVHSLTPISHNDWVSDVSSPGKFNNSEFPLKAYLFSDNEIKAFWRAAFLLETPFLKISKLREMQRIPDGTLFPDDFKEGKKDSMKCGEAVYSSSIGYVNFKNTCLRLETSFDKGFFYESLSHELAHQIENETIPFQFTERYEYYDFAGFKLKVEIDEATGAKKSKWEPKENAKFVSWYADKSPGEHFAENIAYFRVDGDLSKKNNIKEVYDYFSTKHFENKSYDSPSFFESWMNKKIKDINSRSMKVIPDCITSNTYSVAGELFKASDFTSPLLASQLSCISGKMLELSKELKTDIQSNEVEGCRLLETSPFHPNVQLWEMAFKKKTIPVIDKYLQEYSKDKNYFERIKDFNNQVSDPKMAALALVECFDEENQATCYATTVKDMAFQKAREFDLIPEQTNELAELYSQLHPFEKTQNFVFSQYRIFVDSHQERVVQKTDWVWQSCQVGVANDDAPPVGGLFRLDDGYMVSSIFNCLNALLPSEVRSLVRELMIEKSQSNHPNDELILNEILKPVMAENLKRIYLNERVNEDVKIKKFLADGDKSIRELLVSDFTWVKQVSDNQLVQKACEQKALELVKFSPLYHLKQRAFKSFTSSSCAGITESSEFKTWIEGQKGDVETKLYTNLEEKVSLKAREVANTCVKKYPTDTSLNRAKFKKERDECLLGGWGRMEDEALKEVSSDPLVSKLSLDLSQLPGRLVLNRRKLQLKILKEFNF